MRAKLGDINFARLNHILIPETKEGRDRFRKSRVGRLVRPLGWFYSALSDEGRVLAAVSFLLGGVALDVQGTDAHLVWAAMVAVVVASLAARPFFRVDRARLEIDAPRRVTVGEVARVGVTVHVDGDVDLDALRVSGPFLPWDGAFVGRTPRFARVAAGASARGEIGLRFAARGDHHLEPFRVGALVPFGLAIGPSVASPPLKIVVVPRIANVARLSMPRGSRHQPGGVPLASRTGESMDLLGVRPYRPGDPVRQLHARSWARTGVPVVREYQEEYFTRVGVVVDTAPVPEAQFEAMLSLAAGVVARLTRGEGLVDLLVVGGRVHDLTLGRHLGFLEQALDLLASVTMARAPTPPDVVMGALSRHLSRLSALVVVSGAWDGGALADRVRASGVACSTAVVARAGEPRALGKHVIAVTADAITRGEAVIL